MPGKEKGASDEFRVALLSRRGWPADDVYAALAVYWERTSGIAVPTRSARGESARDAFLYLLSFATLATWAIALSSMLFRFIEYWLPDPVAHEHWRSLRRTVTWHLASIAVAFPIYVSVARSILREAQVSPERLPSGVRKWLTCIALLLTAGAMIADLICFLDYFLTGELTSRFLLKCLVVMVVAGTVFAYHLRTLRWKADTEFAQAKKMSAQFAWATAATVVASFCIGLGVAGTPATQRHIAADEMRVRNLRSIAFALHDLATPNAFHTSSEPLPADLKELVPMRLRASDILDPETRARYEYVRTGASEYEVCATFYAQEEDPATTQAWHHGAGRACFRLNATRQPSY